MYMSVYVWGQEVMSPRVWSENHFFFFEVRSLPSFLYGFKELTQVIRLGKKCHNLLGHGKGLLLFKTRSHSAVLAGPQLSLQTRPVSTL